MLVQVVTLNFEGMTYDDVVAASEQFIPPLVAMPGLLSKTWLANPETNTYGGVYLWADREALDNYAQSDFWRTFTSDPRVVNVRSESFGILEEPSRATNGLGVPVA